MPKKVLLINNLYQPYSVGGAEKVVEARAKEYLQEGNEVIIITTAPWTGFVSLKPQVSIEEGIKIYRFYPLNLCWYKNLSKHGFVFKLFWHLIDVFGGGRVVKKIIREEKPNVVELHNLMGVAYLKIKRFKDLKIKTICFLHDVQLVEPSGVLMWNHKKDSVWKKIYSWVMKKKLGSPDLVISPSEFLQKFYQERDFFVNSNWKLEQVSPLLRGADTNAVAGVSAEVFPLYERGGHEVPGVLDTLTNTPHPSGAPLNRGETPLNFLFVGSLVPHKGIRVLMQAWDLVRHSRESGNLGSLKDPHFRGDDVVLHIVGSGILENEVKEWSKTKHNVTVHGRLEGAELDQVYEQCQILIFPSICLENCPTVIVEALEKGLEVIASDTGGVGELVSEESLVEPGKIEDLRLKIEECLKQKH